MCFFFEKLALHLFANLRWGACLKNVRDKIHSAPPTHLKSCIRACCPINKSGRPFFDVCLWMLLTYDIIRSGNVSLSLSPPYSDTHKLFLGLVTPAAWST